MPCVSMIIEWPESPRIGVLQVQFGRPNWDDPDYGNGPTCCRFASAVCSEVSLQRASLLIAAAQRSPTAAGFPFVKAQHPGNNIGVFCCGPMGKALRQACLKWSEVKPKGDDTGDTIFKLHAEVF